MYCTAQLIIPLLVCARCIHHMYMYVCVYVCTWPDPHWIYLYTWLLLVSRFANRLLLVGWVGVCQFGLVQRKISKSIKRFTQQTCGHSSHAPQLCRAIGTLHCTPADLSCSTGVQTGWHQLTGQCHSRSWLAKYNVLHIHDIRILSGLEIMACILIMSDASHLQVFSKISNNYNEILTRTWFLQGSCAKCVH